MVTGAANWLRAALGTVGESDNADGVAVEASLSGNGVDGSADASVEGVGSLRVGVKDLVAC